MVSRSTLKSWFQTRKKPTENQYSQNFDSFFHLLEDTLPISKVDNLQTILDNLILNQGSGSSGGGGTSQTETYIATTGDFAKVFTVGKTLNGIVIDPPGSGTISVDIGTTAGGFQVEQGLLVDAADPEPYNRSKYIKNPTTWYFKNIPINTVVTFFYK